MTLVLTVIGSIIIVRYVTNAGEDMFKVGDWWKTREGSRVLIWEVHPVGAEEFYPRPMTGVFWRGGVANWPRNGIWSQTSVGESDNDLVTQCSPPKEFGKERELSKLLSKIVVDATEVEAHYRGSNEVVADLAKQVRRNVADRLREIG